MDKMLKKVNKVGDSSVLKEVNKKDTAPGGSNVSKETKNRKVGDILKEDITKIPAPADIQIEVTHASTPSTASHEDLITNEQKKDSLSDGIINPVFSTQGEVIQPDGSKIVTIIPNEHPKPDKKQDIDELTKPDISLNVNQNIFINADGFVNANIHINPDGLVDPNRPSDDLEAVFVQDGFTNPVFSIETASETSKHNTPERVPSLFSFSDNDVNLYNQESQKQYLTLTTKESHSTTSSSLTVPDATGSRRPSDPLTFVQDDNFSQLQPLTNSNGLSKSEGRLPPLSPGYLSPSPYDRFQPPRSPGLLSTNSAWSELAKLHSRRSSYGDYTDDRSSSNSLSYASSSLQTNSNSLSVVSSSLSEHLHQLVRAFSSRTERVKETTIQPPTPSSQDYDAYSDANSAISAADEPEQRQHRLDSFIPMHLRERGPLGQSDEGTLDEYFLECGCCRMKLPSWLKNPCSIPRKLEPQSKLYMTWLFLVTLCFMYNAWVIPLRGVFPYQNQSNLIYWLICDYTCDAIYILDIMLVKPHLTYLNSGLVETDPKLMRKNYMQKRMFKFDVLSLLPLDLFYLMLGVVPWFRLPRLFKIQTFWEFYQRCDQAVKSAHVLRIIKTMTYMLFLIHLETCGYYAVSVYEGIGSNRWVYNGEGIAYIRCFYLATKTATSIGNNPIPTNTLEYIFMTIYWVSGVFVFALLIGQIRDIVDAAGRVKAQYDKMMDDALRYVKNLNCPNETQHKVRTWFLYQWQQQKISDEKKLMDWLPKNLRTDLAIHVHFNTLSKVTLFQDCDKTLLFDLVLKLKPILFLPGEYVCKKGEVGKEMYIVSQGQVEVVGGPEGTTVLATLKEGSVFGEISLLAIAADGNRRTADVRCKGFTNLFILSQTEFEDAMAEYPEAHKLLKKRARKLLRQNAKLSTKSHGSAESSKVEVEPIIRTPDRSTETPKLFKTVLQGASKPMLQPWLCCKLDDHLSGSQQPYVTAMLCCKLDDHLSGSQQPYVTAMALLEPASLCNSHGCVVSWMIICEGASKPMLQPWLCLSWLFNVLLYSVPRDSLLKRLAGVQMPKVSSRPESVTQTSKNIKEPFVGSEISGNYEETCNWVIKQALSTTPEVGKTRRYSRVEDEEQVKKIVKVLTKQNCIVGVNRKDEVELMSSFFEDNDLPENTIRVEQAAEDSGHKDNSGKTEEITKKINDSLKKQVDDVMETPNISFVASDVPVVKDTASKTANSDDNYGLSKAANNNGETNVTSNSGETKASSNTGQKKTSSNSGQTKATNNSGQTKATISGQKKASSISGQTKATNNSGQTKAKNNTKQGKPVSGSGQRKATSNSGQSNVIGNSNQGKSVNKNSVDNAANNSSENMAASNTDSSHRNKATSKVTTGYGAAKISTSNNDTSNVTIDNAIMSASTNVGDNGKSSNANSKNLGKESDPKEVGLKGMDIKPDTENKLRSKHLSSASITCISGDYDQNSEVFLNSLNSDIDHHKLVDDHGNSPGCLEPKGPEVQMNGIPLQNQITCSVEVHREKSLTPVSLKDWIDGANTRTESSVTKDMTLQESSV
ncbi:uncharacterized protein [Argopecten irradians]|uniref:uncharacterized protein n=1 Tax=Argopecten irradians TaxID=31199 RepID=UPI00372430F6